LSLVLRRLPLWIPAAMIAIEAWWVALAWPFLSSHFSVVAPGWPGAAPAGRDLDAALPGAALSFYAPGAVVVLVAMLALFGGIRRLRAGKWDIAPASLVVVVPPAAAIQSYGGIGLYRAFLFALPWLAFFGAAALVGGPSRRRAPQVRFLRTSVVTLALGICLLLACFGQDLGNRVTPGEVRAETWVEQHAPPGSRVLHAAEGPSFLTARYPRIGLEDSLLTREEFQGHRLGSADIPRIRRLANRLRRGLDAFIVLSRRQEDYARLNGVLPEGSIESLTRALQASHGFRLVYRAPGAWVFEYEPRRPRGRARS
jgi:hypothetical protein